MTGHFPADSWAYVDTANTRYSSIFKKRPSLFIEQWVNSLLMNISDCCSFTLETLNAGTQAVFLFLRYANPRWCNVFTKLSTTFAHQKCHREKRLSFSAFVQVINSINSELVMEEFICWSNTELQVTVCTPLTYQRGNQLCFPHQCHQVPYYHWVSSETLTLGAFAFRFCLTFICRVGFEGSK